MTIKINRSTLELPEGSLVRDALLLYGKRRSVSRVRMSAAVVLDELGEPLDLDSPLEDGQMIHCRM